MKHERISQNSLLLVNSKAGSGNARKLAKEINSIHKLRTQEISDFFKLPEQQRNELFATLSHIFVLGGDGSSFSLLNLLLQSSVSEEIVVVPLGLGGENVLSKHVGSYGKSVATVSAVLRGERSENQFVTEMIQPQYAQITSELGLLKEFAFLWSVHAGFSAAVLSEIELLRNIGASDFYRRYGGTLRKLLQLRGADPVYISGEGYQEKQVVDVGVISAGIPFWTSKFRLPTTPNQTAILHTIEGYEKLQKQPYRFALRFILELISLKRGWSIPRELLIHTPLIGDFTVAVSSNNEEIAVDSELYPARFARVSNTSEKVYRPDKVLLAKFKKNSLS